VKIASTDTPRARPSFKASKIEGITRDDAGDGDGSLQQF
jgi:hypothetical protein